MRTMKSPVETGLVGAHWKMVLPTGFEPVF